MSCNEELKANGKAYPRTCEDCRLGPCKKGYSMKPGVPSALPPSVFVVRNDETEKTVVTSTEAEAEKLAELIGGKWDEAPCVSIPS